MRLIDADALQLAIIEKGQANERGKYIIGDIWELTGAEIREVIASQPTIQLEPHWIPVTERLPEDEDYKPFSYYKDGAVLFCTKTGEIGFGWYYESTREWANEDDRGRNVAAWMPLPEPYKGVTDGKD